MSDPEALGLPPGLTFDHFAVAAPRIRDLLPLYKDAMGGTFRGVSNDNPAVGWRCVRLDYADAACVELLEPLAGSTFLDRFLERTGGGGLHHVTFRTPDILGSKRALEERGFQLTGITLTEEYSDLFVHPKSAHGVLVQIAQIPDYRSGSSTVRGITLDDALAGRGYNGTGVPSP